MITMSDTCWLQQSPRLMICNNIARDIGLKHRSNLIIRKLFSFSTIIVFAQDWIALRKYQLMFFFFWQALNIVCHFVWKLRCLSSKAENRQLVASGLSLCQQLLFSPRDFCYWCSNCPWWCSLPIIPERFLFIFFSEILSPLSCSSQKVNANWHYLFIYSSINTFYFFFPAFVFSGVAFCFADSRHPIFLLPCQCQETSSCLQMRKRLRNKRKPRVQQLWILEMGQVVGIARYKKTPKHLQNNRCSGTVCI